MKVPVYVQSASKCASANGGIRVSKHTFRRVSSNSSQSIRCCTSRQIRIDTIFIHDTVLIKEKKNFWGKTKTDTTN